MKNILSAKSSLLLLFLAVTALMINSCKKDSDGSPIIKAGDPVFTDLSPDSGAVGTVVTLKGSGLGDMRTIMFDLNQAPAVLRATLNTDNAIIFQVPDTAIRGNHNIIFTNSLGKTLSVPFKVLPYGVVTSIFPTDFETNSLLTLTGNNLDVVTKIVLDGTTTEVPIISQSLNQAVVKMPATTLNKVRLALTTSAGVRASDIDLINVEQALTIFTQDFVNPAQSWSWGGTFSPASDYSITGGSSLKAAYDPGGTWGGLQIGMGAELPLPAGTKYFTFWVRGADVDKNVKLEIKGNNWALTAPEKTLTIPANKWTYFKEEVSALIPGMSSISVILFQMHDAGKTIYFDNIMFIK